MGFSRIIRGYDSSVENHSDSSEYIATGAVGSSKVCFEMDKNVHPQIGGLSLTLSCESHVSFIAPLAVVDCTCWLPIRAREWIDIWRTCHCSPSEEALKEEQLKVLSVQSRVGLSLGTKRSHSLLGSCSLCSQAFQGHAWLVRPSQEVQRPGVLSLLKVMLNQAIPRRQCEERGNRVRATRRARKLKVPNPSASTGKGRSREEAGMCRLSDCGLPSYQGSQGVLGGEVGNSGARQCSGWVDVKHL